MNRALCALLWGGSLFGLPRAAHATPDYPLVIDATLEVSCPRPLSRCLICHTTARGGQRTAVQPLAQALRSYGLTRGNDVGALRGALQSLPEDAESDGDGVPDKEELRACGNPSGEELGFGPEYGCDGARLAPHAPPDLPLAVVAAGVAAVIVRRRGVARSAERVAACRWRVSRDLRRR